MYPFDVVYLDERRSLRGDHATDHGLQQRWQDRQDSTARATQQVYDQIANHEPTGFIFIVEELRNDCEDVVDPGQTSRVSPRKQLRAVFSDHPRQTDDAVLIGTAR